MHRFRVNKRTIALALILGLACESVDGDVYFWQNASGRWSIGANWEGGFAPGGSNITDVLHFGALTNAGFSGYIATLDSTNFAGMPGPLPSPFLVNRLVFTNQPGAAHVTNLLQGGSLVFDGPSPGVLNHTLTNSVGFVLENELVLNTDVLVAGGGSGLVALRGAVSGTGGLIKEGAGTLVVTASNRYSGDTQLREGTVRILGAEDPSKDPFGTGTLQLGLAGSEGFLTLEYPGSEAQSGGGFAFMAPQGQPLAAPGLPPALRIRNPLVVAGNIILVGDFLMSEPQVDLVTNVVINTPGAGMTALPPRIFNVGGIFSITKTGSGTLVFNGQNFYDGGTLHFGGVVAIGNVALPGNMNRIFGTGPLVLGMTSGPPVTVSALGGPRVVDASHLVFNSDVTFTEIPAPMPGPPGVMPISFVGPGQNSRLNTNVTLTVNNALVLIEGPIIQTSLMAPFGITKVGPGDLILTNAGQHTENFRGPTVLAAGNLFIGSQSGAGPTGDFFSSGQTPNSPLGRSNLVFAGLVGVGGVGLTPHNYPLDLPNPLVFSNAATTVSFLFNTNLSATNDLLFRGNVRLTASHNLNVLNSNTWLCGDISGPRPPPGPLTKTGPGAIVFSGHSTYTNTTVITAGAIGFGSDLLVDPGGLPIAGPVGIGPLAIIAGGPITVFGVAYSRPDPPNATAICADPLIGPARLVGNLALIRGGPVVFAPFGAPFLANPVLPAPFGVPVDFTGALEIAQLGGGAAPLGAAAGSPPNGDGVLILETNLFFSGPVSGIQITKLGPGTLYLNHPSNTYSGMILAEGPLALGASSSDSPPLPGPLGTGALALGTSNGPPVSLLAQAAPRRVNNAISVNTDATFDGDALVLDGNVQLTGSRLLTVRNSLTQINGVVDDGSGAYGFAKHGVGALVLGGINTYEGLTLLVEGTLVAAQSSALGSLTAGTVISPGATLALQGAPLQMAEPLAISGNGVAGAGAIQNWVGTNWLVGPVTLAGNASIGVNAGTRLTLSGGIFDTPGPASLAKIGPGELSLRGASTYRGGTFVQTGALIINNTTNSATGSGSVVVSTGATLGGVGTISGPVMVQGGKVRGMLTLLNTLAASGSNEFCFELSEPTNPTNDVLVVSNDLALAGVVTIIARTNFGIGTYTLVRYTGTLTDDGLSLGTLPSGYSGTLTNDVVNREIRLIVRAPFLTISYDSPTGRVTIRWSGHPQWILQESPSVTGPFTRVAGNPPSPYLLTAPPGQQFYRLCSGCSP